MAILLLPVQGIPSVQPGDDIAQLLSMAISEAKIGAKDGDVLVICQKIVSKSEGRVVDLSSVEPSAFATQWAQEHDKDARLIELVLRESKRIVRMDRGNLIVETGPGWICANAGIDQSNAIAEGTVTLLPLDADASASRLRQALRLHFGQDIPVIITDTFGRPWREGQLEFALGMSGIDPLDDLRGTPDLMGRELSLTSIAVADQLACAAGLLMTKASGVPAVLVRGYAARRGGETRGGRALVRPPENDLFR
jgi:coenzyme F420-0:L-glutamate ligase/coenzyme F420-1:gamma-L-glutamate ligase